MNSPNSFGDIEVTDAVEADAVALAELAAATFPLACPPTSPPADITAFIAAHLSRGRFTDYLADPSRTVLAARTGGRMVGYAMLIDGVGTDPDVAQAVTTRPAVELSKLYVQADSHGSGVAAALMRAAVSRAAGGGAQCVWLGVNQRNRRAQRFYGKQGFVVAGTKSFPMGTHIEQDYVMVRPL
ncbi:GNAT family N-acetyltransferase [Mycolicibacterium rhodesiae]|uniref:GNAT family N-acetyltransferase n=1 Tax=Mycolicibacterium rhodesiae TaxID=36814 RepID=A0A1X0J5B4_MYCRH|nr:GNAT family N-acetyltransferase [Mycolicibacterium rhodesiae]MCV7348334.1 GNAT family N-acetyltransferase [Mycolicibacterium rhodesiae]ORB57342.1 GNAT family N-acetyltransferase [Mycolicibacterium rhodesiae]